MAGCAVRSQRAGGPQEMRKPLEGQDPKPRKSKNKYKPIQRPREGLGVQEQREEGGGRRPRSICGEDGDVGAGKGAAALPWSPGHLVSES